MTDTRDNTPVPYLIQGNNIVVVIGNQSHTVNDSHVSYEAVKQSIKEQDWARLRDVVDPVQHVINYGEGRINIIDDVVHWDGEIMHGALAGRMIDMLREGFEITPLVNFMTNLMDNPSKRSVDELYGFLERNNLPITPDGYFLAYKRVRDDYRDVYTGKIDNTVGQTVSMTRNKVNDNKEQTCSTGLHFCSKEYLGSFGGSRIMILKINPADVVSIPTDYGFSKGRCCRYEVIGELEVSAENAFTSSVQSNANAFEYEEDDWDLDGFDDYEW